MSLNELEFWPGKIPSAENQGYAGLPEDFDHSYQLSIETGYFVFTMMPSLRCSLNCPHCYLTLEQRRNSATMELSDLEIACKKVDEYYQSRTDISRKAIIFYWYGGEPTEMGLPYFLKCFEMIDRIFTEKKGYYVRHDVLTSLLNIEDIWFDVFKRWGESHFQTSFDGLMRGKGYIRKWEARVKQAVKLGLSVSTISVVNNDLLNDGPKNILDYLVSLGVVECSFLPFMLNEQNSSGSYEKYAPPMSGYSDFMIELSEYWVELKKQGVPVPAIGQMSYVASRIELPGRSNIAAQTMFLLPNGDFVLPDYREGYLEYMKPFGNILESSFEGVIASRSRRDYIRKQYTRNKNKECLSCGYQDICIMEFWKENRFNDECFGARRYVEWINARIKEIGINGIKKQVMF